MNRSNRIKLKLTILRSGSLLTVPKETIEKNNHLISVETSEYFGCRSDGDILCSCCPVTLEDEESNLDTDESDSDVEDDEDMELDLLSDID